MGLGLLVGGLEILMPDFAVDTQIRGLNLR
jgi:hypothetical protein